MALDKKQKVMIPLVIVAFAFLGWEGYKLLSNDDGGYQPPANPVASPRQAVPQSRAATVQATPTNATASSHAGTSPAVASQQPQSSATGQTTTTSTGVNVNTATNNTSATTADADKAKTQATQQQATTLTPEEKAALAKQKALEQRYVQMVTQYQFAQAQKKLTDANTALLESKVREAQTAAKAQAQSGVSAVGLEHQSISSGAQVLSRYHLLYVGRVNGHWVATLRYLGHMQDVNIGSNFADGTSVRVIDRNGVVLQNKGVSRYLKIASPLMVADQAESSDATSAKTDRQPGRKTAEANVQTTSQSAQQVYDTLSSIQQSVQKTAQ